MHQSIWNKPLDSAEVKHNFRCGRDACRCVLYNTKKSRNKVA